MRLWKLGQAFRRWHASSISTTLIQFSTTLFPRDRKKERVHKFVPMAREIDKGIECVYRSTNNTNCRLECGRKFAEMFTVQSIALSAICRHDAPAASSGVYLESEIFDQYESWIREWKLNPRKLSRKFVVHRMIKRKYVQPFSSNSCRDSLFVCYLQRFGQILPTGTKTGVGT